MTQLPPPARAPGVDAAHGRDGSRVILACDRRGCGFCRVGRYARLAGLGEGLGEKV